MPTPEQLRAARALQHEARQRGQMVGPLIALVQNMRNGNGGGGGGGGFGGGGPGGGGGGGGNRGFAGGGAAPGGSGGGGRAAPAGGANGANGGAAGNTGGGFGSSSRAAQQRDAGAGGGGGARDDAGEEREEEDGYGGGWEAGDHGMIDDSDDGAHGMLDNQGPGFFNATSNTGTVCAATGNANISPETSPRRPDGQASKRARTDSESGTSSMSPEPVNQNFAHHSSYPSKSVDLPRDQITHLFGTRRSRFTTEIGLAALRAKYGVFSNPEKVDLSGYNVVEWPELPDKVDADAEKDRLRQPKKFDDPISILRLPYSYDELKTKEVRDLRVPSSRTHTFAGDVVLISKDNVPVAWHGQEAFTLLVGGDARKAKRGMDAMSDELKELVKFYGGINPPAQADCRHHSPAEGYPEGCGIEHLLCWAECGHHNPASYKVSGDFVGKHTTDTLTRTMSYGTTLAAGFELAAAFACATDPTTYLKNVNDYQAKLGGGHYDRLINNASHFNQGVAVLHDLRVLPHLDKLDEKNGWAFTVPFGQYEGGEMRLRQFGLRFMYRPGDVVALRSAFIWHEVENYAGFRQALVFFSRESFRKLSTSRFMDWWSFKLTGLPRFGRGRETKKARDGKRLGVKRKPVTLDSVLGMLKGL